MICHRFRFWVYYPKASGLQRPISLLCIEDQIVLQAITNLFAKQVRERKRRLDGKSVFSNWLATSRDSEFFLRDWKYGYYELRKSLKAWYRQGYVWAVNFDLAAFYDTIPHELLLRLIAPHGGKSDLTNLISTCLKTWSADNHSTQHNHGIPQGPLASSFLAECIMLTIDEKISQHFVYLRYVDDIRILGRTEMEVRKALVDLDVLCREAGLIPSSEKTEIFKIDKIDQLLNTIPEILLYETADGPILIPARKAEKIVEEAILREKDNIIIVDKSKFRYIMFRTEASDKILKIVIDLWTHAPQHIDAFLVFLENYDREEDIVSLCKRDIVENPYDFVRGASWEVLTRMCTHEEYKQLTSFAIEVVKSKSGSATRIGAYRFLLRCEEIGLGAFSKWVMYEKSPIVQSVSIKNFVLEKDKGTDLAKQILRRKTPDVPLGLTVPLLNSSISIQELGCNLNDLSQVIRNVYFKSGIVSDGTRSRVDIIGNKLAKKFKIQKWGKWRVLFGADYQHAHSLLSLAESYYKGHKSAWLAQQDAFNDALFRSFQLFLNSKNVAGAIPVIDAKGKLVDYGIMITNNIFKSPYPTLAEHLIAVHNRRSTLPNAHPYEKHTGRKSLPLKTNEQRDMVAHLAASYMEIMKIVTQVGI